ncbi:MAG: DUF2569 family protein [Candidatus Taylorbacteria bacterium]|nr:DUF2569 family protein [Candidatus Taylorbacteria bacterium]
MSEYKGLGGWLILVILLLFVRIVNIGQSTILILTAGREYGNNTGEFVFDFLSSFLITVLYAYVIYLFFSRKRKFPKYYILLNIIIVMTYVITFITMVDDPQKDFLGKAAGSVIYAIICGIYVTVSKRVKATFIED